jgi:hypothetical protein
MKNRGRPKTSFHLETSDDANLWEYTSLAEALSSNIDLLAALGNTDHLFPHTKKTSLASPSDVKNSRLEQVSNE